MRRILTVNVVHGLVTAMLSAWLGGCATTREAGPAPVTEIAPQAAAPIPEAQTKPAELPPAAIPPPLPTTALPLPLPTPRPIERDSRALLLQLLPPKISDRNGWASDIHTAFAALRIPATPENYCATIAVIEQESGFQADPVVPGLSRIVWKEIETRRNKYAIPKVVLDVALRKSSPDGRSYKARINALKTERQMNALFEDMIAELPDGKRLLSGYNPIRTGGPMQVSVDFAEAQARAKPYPYARQQSLRDEVFTRRGGVYFGIANLLDYPAPYSQNIYRFADFNAGRYSSRNAAFQHAVSKLGGSKLALDGDLLRYVDGAPSNQVSITQRTLLPLSKALGMSKADILRDLRLEKSAAFAQTPLYQRVFTLAEQKASSQLPREAMPQIRLKSPKIQRRLTTEWFAKRVDSRYRNCLGQEKRP
jgi:hypothetical protein